MGGREPLSPGKAGKISFSRIGNGKQWQACCRFRDLDGSGPVKVAAQGKLKRDAEAALLTKLAARGAGDLTALKPHSTFADAGKLWLAKVAAKRRGSTYDTYRRWLENRVIPDLGGLRLRECVFGLLDAYMVRLAAEVTETGTLRYSANSLRGIRKVISGPLALAVKHGALTANPVRDMDEIEGQGSPPRALTVEERRRLRAWLRDGSNDPQERAAQEAARRRDLPDLVDFMLGTGVRIGEALAVRWRDLDLEGVPVANLDGSLRLAPIVTVSGNIVRETGKGLVRHEGKTKRSIRTFELPQFVVTMLARRRPEGAGEDSDLPVFPALGRDGLVWKDPNNTQTYIREMRDAIGWPWMTSHNWRETAATIWMDSDEMTDRALTENMGHADPNFTRRVYGGRGELHLQAARIMDAAYADD